MKKDKKAFAVVIACIIVILASIFVWNIKPTFTKGSHDSAISLTNATKKLNN